MKTPFLIGRIIFGGFFLHKGISHVTERREMAKLHGVEVSAVRRNSPSPFRPFL